MFRFRRTEGKRRPPGLKAPRPLGLEVLEDRTMLSGTAATLQLLPAAGQNTPAVTLPLDAFQFGFHNPVTIGIGSSRRLPALGLRAGLAARRSRRRKASPMRSMFRILF
jgi:hypothetical protein